MKKKKREREIGIQQHGIGGEKLCSVEHNHQSNTSDRKWGGKGLVGDDEKQGILVNVTLTLHRPSSDS